jgi:urocanate hydratase
VRYHHAHVFDYGFGPFRWFVLGMEDLQKTDTIVQMLKKWQTAPIEIQQQMQDNIQWIKVRENKLVVGSQARILYADAKAA